MAKYPIHFKPTNTFKKRLKAEAKPYWIVKDLRFVQWAAKRFSAQWHHGKKGEAFTAEMTLGGTDASLAAIEARVIKFMK